MKHWTTADLVDEHGDGLVGCSVQFRNFGSVAQYCGAVRTIKAFEDNALIKSTLSEPGEGGVLVVDGGGSLRCAMVGDIIAGLAADHDWSGIVVFGAVRDTVALGGIAIGIKALGSSPLKSKKAGTGQLDVPVEFGGAVFHSGDWLYSDQDGILVSRERLR